ncbi:hypothetical protein LB505_010108 [Fusarium chuoi]|nr:hypothetical protein LB505_010108 [Fusarium chuoi]
MVFFITLAYIAISIDASGIIRWLAFKVLSWGGKVGHRLFFYLYSFFFLLGSFIGNDPIILSGTAFLAYMTRVSSNITIRNRQHRLSNSRLVKPNQPRPRWSLRHQVHRLHRQHDSPSRRHRRCPLPVSALRHLR